MGEQVRPGTRQSVVAVLLAWAVGVLFMLACEQTEPHKLGASPQGLGPATTQFCASADGGSCVARFAVPRSSVGTAYVWIAGTSPVYDGGHLNGAAAKYSCTVETFDAGYVTLKACAALEALVFTDAGTVDSAFTTTVALSDGAVTATLKAHKLVHAPTTWKVVEQWQGVP